MEGRPKDREGSRRGKKKKIGKERRKVGNWGNTERGSFTSVKNIGGNRRVGGKGKVDERGEGKEKKGGDTNGRGRLQ